MKILIALLVIMMMSFSIVASSYEVFAQTVPQNGQNRPLAAQITLTKSVDKPVVLSGTSVTYTYVLQNTGTEPVLCTGIFDDKIGVVAIGPSFGLGVGSSKTFTKGTTILVDTTNTATATCQTNQGVIVTDVSNAVFVDVVDPEVTIIKSVDQTVVTAGTDVTYSYEVENTGDVDLSSCQIVDSVNGNVGAPFSLLQGNTNTETDLVTINSDVTNDATVTCDVPTTVPSTTSAISNEVTVNVVGPEVTIVKSVDDTEVPPGTLVTYTYDVENTGDVDLTNCQIVDSVLGNIASPFNLAQGATNQETDSATINSDVTNDATVTCDVPTTPPSTTSATSNEVTVTVILTSSVDLIKTADPTLIEAGETVTYTYDVTNNGDTDLTDCNITDDKLGPVGDVNFALVSGNSATFTASTEIFVDTLNSATVLCLDPDSNPVGDTDTATVTVLVVGGGLLPIDTTALLVAGAQANAAWILSVLAVIGSVAFGALYITSKRN